MKMQNSLKKSIGYTCAVIEEKQENIIFWKGSC
jgi:hypothetical protein